MTINQLKYLLETKILGVSYVVNKKVVDEALYDILEIHKRVLGHAGRFRNEQVYVGGHILPPPEQVPKLMNAYVECLNFEEIMNMHPVRLAALAHYKLVDIHPFLYGTVRTSRLIMNLILLKAGYPPIIIYKDMHKYYECLMVANTGDNKKLEGVSQELEDSSPVIEIDKIGNV